MKKLIALVLIALLALIICAGALSEPSAEPSAGPEASPQPAKGYVLVTTATQMGWLPLPEEGEVSYPLKQVLPDGTEAVNVIHLTPAGVYMEDSTCANHDCIDEGEVVLALLVVGGLSLIVGFTLMHYIGGFLRTVEREAREEEARRDAADAARRLTAVKEAVLEFASELPWADVILDNKDTRILGNMILCLPNQVTLQLFTPEEVLELLKGE